MFGESLALKRRANRTALGVRPDTMRVVVYTRDRSGAIGRVESVVRVVAPGQ
jgi:hypothetical protein